MRKIDRFLQYLDYKGITENKATVDCSLSKGLLGQAKSGKSDLGNKAVEKILSFYQDLSRVWLLTGSGKMLNTSINKEAAEELNQPENPMNEQPEEKRMVDTLLFLVESQKKDIETLIQLVKEKDTKIDELLTLAQDKDERIEELLDEINARKRGDATSAARSSSASAI